MKNRLDINHVIRHFGLDRMEVARELFPDNKHPLRALARLADGLSELTETQIRRLAEITGAPVGELLESSDWKAVSKDGLYTLTYKGYRAEFNLRTWISRVYDKDKLLREELLTNQAISVKSYIDSINQLISEYEIRS